MKQIEVDVAVIGTGSAGLNAYRNAKKLTSSVLTIQHGPYGTTCARVGCMPSKLLISAAESVHAISEAPVFGVHPEAKPRIDGKDVMHRVKSERDRFVGFVVKDSVGSIPDDDKLVGFARFIDDHTLQVDDHTLVKAKRIVIATGSTPMRLPMFEPAGDRVIVNDDVFDWETLPESVVVFGPGVIGLELGQALHRLGVRVRIFGKGGFVGPLTDPSVKAEAEKCFQNELYLDADATINEIMKKDDKVIICFTDLDGQEQTEEFEFLLASTGRVPNVKDIGLENTSLELDERGVPLFDNTTMQCGNSHIFIAGDANNQLPLLHEASDEGKIAGTNAGQYPQISPGLRRSPISVVFSDPQIAMVGTMFKDLEEGKYAIGEVNFAGQGRSRVMHQNRGLLRIYGDPESRRFLGAEMVGPRAEHIAHLLAWSHQCELTVDKMLDMPFYHPVIEEGLRTALQNLSTKLTEALK